MNFTREAIGNGAPKPFCAGVNMHSWQKVTCAASTAEAILENQNMRKSTCATKSRREWEERGMTIIFPTWRWVIMLAILRTDRNDRQVEKKGIYVRGAIGIIPHANVSNMQKHRKGLSGNVVRML